MKRSFTIILLSLILLFTCLFPVRADRQVLLFGDTDRDGSITEKDAAEILKAAIGLESFSDGTLDHALRDVDFDGRITFADARLVLRAARLPDAEPMGKAHVHEWKDWKTVAVPTCTEDGEQQRVCKKDKHHVSVRALPAGHTAKKQKDGTYLCKVCGNSFYDPACEQAVFALDHAPAEMTGSEQTVCTDAFRKHRTVSAQVAFIEDALVTKTFAYGTAVRGGSRMVDDDTKYRVASLSKLVTDMAFMALEDRERVFDQADISGYFGYTCRNPYYPDTVITPRQIMTHTASFDTNGSFTLYDGMLARSAPYLWIDPGSDYLYSNLGIGVLSCLCERVSGKSLTTIAQEYLFQPLGIDAAFYASGLEDTSNLAALYGEDGGFSVGDMLSWHEYPLGTGMNLAMGNLTISAKDYAKLLCMLMNGGKAPDGRQVLSEQSAAKMMRSYFRTEKFGVGYGVQLQTNVLDGKTVLVHTGSSYGMYAAFVFDPAEKTGAVVLTSGGIRSEDMETEIYDVCLEIIRGLWPGAEVVKADAPSK
ncbi:MAG: serine hydrolase [Clostridia bacterium]|nr:serine hydrolase [Clostridia bacterium]